MTFLVTAALYSVVPDTASVKLLVAENREAVQDTAINEGVRAMTQWLSGIGILSSVWATLSRSWCVVVEVLACAQHCRNGGVQFGQRANLHSRPLGHVVV